jgi:hypothetical protein
LTWVGTTVFRRANPFGVRRGEGVATDRRTPRVFATPGRHCGRAALDSREPNIHKTGSARGVVSSWYPFYEREVTVHSEQNRRGAIVVICSAGIERMSYWKLPVSTFDPALCCGIQSGHNADVTCEAQSCLRRALDSVAGNDASAAQIHLRWRFRCTKRTKAATQLRLFPPIPARENLAERSIPNCFLCWFAPLTEESDVHQPNARVWPRRVPVDGGFVSKEVESLKSQ